MICQHCYVEAFFSVAAKLEEISSRLLSDIMFTRMGCMHKQEIKLLVPMLRAK